jgi:hypothetical protein
MRIVHARQHHQFHEALDKGRFAGSDRTYDAYVDFPVRSGLNVTVYVKIVHKNTPLAMLIQVYARGKGAYAKKYWRRGMSIPFFFLTIILKSRREIHAVMIS